jgi:hypothetical protein
MSSRPAPFRLAPLLVGLLAAPVALAAEPPGTFVTNPAALPTALVPPEPGPPPPAARPLLEVTTLRLLLARGLVTQEEYDTAVQDLLGSAGRPGESPTVAIAGWQTTFYGYVDLDTIWDSTQSFGEAPGNAAVARPDTYAGQHPRLQFTVRDTRFGFRLAPPPWGALKVSGNLELDLSGGAGLGTLGAPGNVSEAAFFTNPTVRIRTAWGKLETPIVDVLFGQTWVLFGWLPFYTPTTAQATGLPGEIFARTPQLRVSKSFKTDLVNVDLALAALRPVQRDSAVPDGQAGARVSFPRWTGWHTSYANATSLVPASLGVSGALRQLVVGQPYLTASATRSSASTFVTGAGFAVDAYLPVLPATRDDKSNSLSVIGELALGASINDLYTGLTGGVGAFTSRLPATQSASGSVDNGLVIYDPTGKLVQPRWLTSFVGLEYFLPGGRVTLFVNWAHTQLQNAREVPTAPASLRNHANLYSAGAVLDLAPQVRMAVDYARTVDVYQDASVFTGALPAASTATNDAVHGKFYFFF